MFGALDLRPLSDDIGPIVLHDSSPGWTTTDSVCHVNWINSCLPFPLGEWPSHWKQHHKFLLAGLQYSWFCMGSFSLALNELFFASRDLLLRVADSGVQDFDAYRDDFLIPWLNAMLYWIDDVSKFDIVLLDPT